MKYTITIVGTAPCTTVGGKPEPWSQTIQARITTAGWAIHRPWSFKTNCLSDNFGWNLSHVATGIAVISHTTLANCVVLHRFLKAAHPDLLDKPQPVAPCPPEWQFWLHKAFECRDAGPCPAMPLLSNKPATSARPKGVSP